MRQLSQKQTLLYLLFLCGTIRGICGFFSIGFDHPNEIFRLLEPLAQLKGFTSFQAWEWTEGLLSSWPVRFHLALLQGAELLGIHGALAELIFLHTFYALLSLTQVWAAFQLVHFSGGSQKLALLSGALVGFWPELVYQSVRLMDYSLEASGLAIVCVWTLQPQKSWVKDALCGLLLGCMFFVRFQTGLHLISVCCIILAAKATAETQAKKKKLLRLCTVLISYGLVVFGLAWIESSWRGTFLSPFINYMQFNWLEGGATRDYGTAPWYRYFSEITKFYGITGFVGLLFLTLNPRVNPKILLFLLLPISIHSVIQHKEPRFIFGVLWLLIPLAVSALAKRNRFFETNWRKWTVIGLIGMGFIVSGYRVSQRFLLSSGDSLALIEAGETIRERDHGNSRPIVIGADPIFAPAGFYLRTQTYVCYDFSDLERNKYPCSEKLQKNHWYLAKMAPPSPRKALWNKNGWFLSLVEK